MMHPPIVPQESIYDLWARAASQLPDEDKRNINFSRPEKLQILADLLAEAEKAKQRSIKSRWKYTRKSGQTVIIRDVFEKIVRWIEMFKQVGDVAVQYDPAHASLPWAGIRSVLQVVVNDFHKLALVVEGLARIAELICRHAVIESLYLQGAPQADQGLERAVVKLYANILGYLSKVKQYFDQGTLKRIAKSAAIVETQPDLGMDDIGKAEVDVDRLLPLVDKNDTVRNHTELKGILERIDMPLRRMDDDLKDLKDDLQASRRAQIIRWLSSEPYKQHHNQVKQGVLKGTGQWLLSDPVFKKWKNESASSILWLHGIPGSGKSKLVSIVTEDAMKDFDAGNSPRPVFFYCSRNPAEPTRSDPRVILASLARQLSCLGPGKPLLKPTVDLFNQKEEEEFASGPLQMDESRNLLLQLIEQYPLTTIVIDAMDECEPSKRRELLKALEQILRDSASLVKIFVSSRNDQDIVLRLQHYPNLEIESQRNSHDIELFVKSETDRLIQDGELLQHSSSKVEMGELIVGKVIEGATGMFRWASMQLQYLCALNLDADIKSSLGRLPPDLDTLYAEIYSILSTNPGKVQAIIFKNILCWLLCAQMTLRSKEFLSMVSMSPQLGDEVTTVTKDLVLKICNNFVVFDSQLDTFRFAHLSVREFLERRPDFDNLATNALAAEVCLWTMLSSYQNLAAKNALLQLGWHTNTELARFEKLYFYVDAYWTIHCKLARHRRRSGNLMKALRFLLVGDVGADSCIILWKRRLERYNDKRSMYLLRLYKYLMKELSVIPIGLFISCIFDFEEQIEHIMGGTLATQGLNGQFKSLVELAAASGSCATLACLLKKDEHGVENLEQVVTEAVGNETYGKETVTILIDQRGAQIPLTEQVVREAASNRVSGREIMMLLLTRRAVGPQLTEGATAAIVEEFDKEVIEVLLARQVAAAPFSKATLSTMKSFDEDVVTITPDRRRENFKITERIVQAAARNRHNKDEVMAALLNHRGADVPMTEATISTIMSFCDKEVVALLLAQRGEDIKITEEVAKAAAGGHDGSEVMALLLDQRGKDIKITEEVAKAAAGGHDGSEVMALLLDQLGEDLPITKEVLNAAAENLSTGDKVLEVLLDQRREDIVRIVGQMEKRTNHFEKLTSTCCRVRIGNSWRYIKHGSKA